MAPTATSTQPSRSKGEFQCSTPYSTIWCWPECNKPVQAFVAAGLLEQQVLFPPPQKKEHAPQPSVPVRLIRVELDQQVEVLVTSLLDEHTYSAVGFAALYSQRWGVETCFDVLKNVLTLENFAGYSQQAVEQDFYSCLFLLHLKALLEEELQEQLQARYSHRQHTYQLNTAVALSLLKDQIGELFIQQEPQAILDKLRTILLEQVEPVRKGRKYQRKKNWYHVPKLKKNRKS